MNVDSPVRLQRFQDAEQPVALLSFDAKLKGRPRLVLLAGLFLSERQPSEMQGGLKLALGEGAGTEVISPQ